MYLHQIAEMPVGKLRPSQRNARTHSKKQIQQIANSVLRFGWTYPILIDEQGNILCGVGRWLAAQKLGFPQGKTDDQVDSVSQALAYKTGYDTSMKWVED